MTLVLELTPEEVATVRAAEANGIHFTPMVKGLIAGLKEAAQPLPAYPAPTKEERLAAWTRLTTELAVPGVVVDDSREAIYSEAPDRG